MPLQSSSLRRHLWILMLGGSLCVGCEPLNAEARRNLTAPLPLDVMAPQHESSIFRDESVFREELPGTTPESSTPTMSPRARFGGRGGTSDYLGSVSSGGSL